MFIAAQFTIAKCWKQPKCPSVNEWINKLWYTCTMEYCAAEREKELLPFANSMDGTGQHYAKWNKPGGERQIPYGLTYKWNLINKTNKQAKYNQKHWNKEQTDSNHTREGRGIMGGKGEGTTRNMYKRHMDKAKGVRFEGGRWGWVGWGNLVPGKGRQLSLNNNN